jgi:hypothetical protein
MEKDFMNMRCEDLDTLLAEGDPLSMQMAAKHAAGCPSCMDRLASWNEISEVARGMSATWNNEMLWPRIERALRDERRRRSALWQIAAAVVLLAGLAVVGWKAHQKIRASEFDNAILRAAAVDQVEQAEKAHLAAIDRLEKLLEPKLNEGTTPLLVSYKEKLMVLDDAIAECQTNIERNRQNAHLRKQLLAIYSDKQRTLQEVLREERHVSNR